MAETYWRKVASRAWDKTWRWSKEKVLGGVALLIGAFIVGGVAAGFNLLSGSISVVVGFAVVTAVMFVWNVCHTTAELHNNIQIELDAAIDNANKQKLSYEAAIDRDNKRAVEKLEAAAWRKRAPPDYQKWRHVQTLNLQQAAQLWTDETPSMGMFGKVKETYAMLCGAIQSGDLAFVSKFIGDPRMQETLRQREQQNPNPDMKVTREALKAFAKRHGYDPTFLRDV